MRHIIKYTAYIALAILAFVATGEGYWELMDGKSIRHSLKTVSVVQEAYYNPDNARKEMYSSMSAAKAKSEYVMEEVPQIQPLPEHVVFDSRVKEGREDELDMLYKKLANEG